VGRVEIAQGLPSPRSVARRWFRLFIRTLRRSLRDEISNAAAGVTFYTLLAFFPVVGALVSLYGLFADISMATKHLDYLSGVLPEGVLRFVGDEMVRAATTHPAIESGFARPRAVDHGANAGVQALVNGLNLAYQQKETRGFPLQCALARHNWAFTLILAFGILFWPAVRGRRRQCPRWPCYGQAPLRPFPASIVMAHGARAPAVVLPGSPVAGTLCLVRWLLPSCGQLRPMTAPVARRHGRIHDVALA
jgi:hypothetical protein